MTQTLLRFGSIATITAEGGLERAEIEKVHEYQTTCRLVRYTRSINARSRKDALAECLKLFDHLELPETTEINFHCERTQNSNMYRLEATWTIKELQ